MDPLYQEIVKQGLLGALFVLLLVAYRSRDKSYIDVQEKRIEERGEMIERLLTAINASTKATESSANGFSVLTKVVEERVPNRPGRGR